MLKRAISLILFLAALAAVFGIWFLSLLSSNQNASQLQATQRVDIPYLQAGIISKRGKILAVLTSTDRIGDTDEYTGYELTELSRAYWVFVMNGFDVDIASVAGGEPPAVIDNDDMTAFDYAFLNDIEAQKKVFDSIPIENVKPLGYQAVYFVGGKGAMFDFPNNVHVKNAVKELYSNDRVIGAICHGPAAFVNVKVDNGEYLVEGKSMTSFTNEEELLLKPKAEKLFPFLLESKLREHGANFEGGLAYLNKVHRDGNIVTGQNPWSVWETAEQIVRALGYEPVPRETSRVEHSIELLEVLYTEGYDEANKYVQIAVPDYYERNIIAMHSVVALMKFNFWQAIQIVRLTYSLKSRAIEAYSIE